jgi:tetratricopeptide (TPR) repeat protein
LETNQKQTKHSKKVLRILIPLTGGIATIIAALIGSIGNKRTDVNQNNVSNINNIENVNGNIITNVYNGESDANKNAGNYNILNTSDANELYKIALNHFDEKKYSEAINYYSLVINMDKNFYQAYLDRGTSYACLKKWKEATFDFWFIKNNFPKIRNIANVNDSFYYVQEMWSDSNSFVNDISERKVLGTVNDEDGLVLRKVPYIREENNRVRTLEQNEIVSILTRSENRQKILPYNTYWYEVETVKGEKGWVYGWFLDFFPSD